jgi:hypothetical protein
MVFVKKTITEKALVKSIPKRKQQKQARKIQKATSKRKKNHSLGKRLTPEEKKRRSQQLIERKEFKQKRRLLNKEKEETAKIKHINSTLLSIFNLEGLDLLAKKIGFIKRGGEITAFSFVYIVSFGFFGNGEIALTYLVAGLWTHFKVIVTPQALSKRINSKTSSKFLKAVLQELLGVQIKIGLKNQFSELSSMFSGIYLQDSTQVSLNEELSEHFQGSGGGASKSAFKLDFIYDIANFLVYGLKITKGTFHDTTNAKEILKFIKTGSLVIRDLGYFTIDCLKKIEAKKSYYLSRLSISTYIYLNKDDDEPLAIPEYLKKITTEGKDSASIKVYVGKLEKLETRLVAEKVPKKVIDQRAARYKKEYKKIPCEYYLDWSGFSIFITNIPEVMFSNKMIVLLYKIRWQIELVFKNLKTNIEIDIMKGTNKNRIESLIYGKLITVVVTFIIHNYSAHLAEDKEVSGDKLTKLLMSDNRLRDAVIRNDLSMLLIDLGYDVILICKQKRKRETTCRSIKEALKDENPGKTKIQPQRINVELYFDENQLQNVV